MIIVIHTFIQSQILISRLRASQMCRLHTERFWLLLFLPSFVRYLLLMRTSLRPRPLVVGEVVDFGSLDPLVSPHAQLEVCGYEKRVQAHTIKKCSRNWNTLSGKFYMHEYAYLCFLYPNLLVAVLFICDVT
jgi:hypothetical protein